MHALRPSSTNLWCPQVTNIACDDGRYIQDVEVAYLLQEMVKKELVVLDCYHSSGANRGHGDRTVRSIERWT